MREAFANYLYSATSSDILFIAASVEGVSKLFLLYEGSVSLFICLYVSEESVLLGKTAAGFLRLQKIFQYVQRSVLQHCLGNVRAIPCALITLLLFVVGRRGRQNDTRGKPHSFRGSILRAYKYVLSRCIEDITFPYPFFCCWHCRTSTDYSFTM
jgi:hypothetical protein